MHTLLTKHTVKILQKNYLSQDIHEVYTILGIHCSNTQQKNIKIVSQLEELRGTAQHMLAVIITVNKISYF